MSLAETKVLDYVKPYVSHSAGLVREMPTGLRDMDLSSGNTLAEALRALGAKLTQEASSIR